MTETMQWTVRLGPKAILLVDAWRIPGVTICGREISGPASALGDLAVRLSDCGPIGLRAAAKCHRLQTDQSRYARAKIPEISSGHLTPGEKSGPL